MYLIGSGWNGLPEVTTPLATWSRRLNSEVATAWNTVREALATSGYTRTVSGTVADALERVRNSRNGMGHRDVPAVEPERLRDAREKIQRAQERLRELTIMLEEM